MKITQTKDIRAANRWEIIKQILHNYPISRVDICSLTGLNKATVSTIVKEWIDAGLLTETELGKSASGRKPILLQPVLSVGYVIAVDIDVRNVQTILIFPEREFCPEENFPLKTQTFPQYTAKSAAHWMKC